MQKPSAGPPTQEQPQHSSSSSEGAVATLEHKRVVELEQQLSEALDAQNKRDRRLAQLTDQLALKSALLDQAEANASEAAKRAGLELRGYVDQLLVQTSLVKQRDVELVNMQARLRDNQAELDKLLVSRDQRIGQYEEELANVRAKLEAKKSELEAVRLRLTDAEIGWAKSKAEADTLRPLTTAAASPVNMDEDRVMRRLMGCMQAEMASLRWNEKSIESMECRNEG